MARVNLDHANTTSLSFIGDKAEELGKAPRVHTALPRTFTMGDTLSDVRQVLKHDGTAGGSMPNDAFRKHVVMVASLPKQLTRKLFQVPFSRFGAFFLKLAPDTEDTAFLLFPVPLTEEVASAGDCRSIETEINPKHLLRGRNGRSRDGYSDMEKVVSFAETQVSRTDLATDVLSGVLGDGEPYLKTACYRCQASGHRLPLDPRGPLVIADRSGLRLGTTNWFECGRRFSAFPGFCYQLGITGGMLLLPRERRFHGLRRLDTSGTNQLSRQIGKLSTQGIVRLLMQLNTVATPGRKALVGDSVKAGCMLFKRCLEASRLIGCGLELCDNRSIHTEGISYMSSFCKYKKGEARSASARGNSSPRMNAGVSLPLSNEAGSYDDGVRISLSTSKESYSQDFCWHKGVIL